MDTRTLSLTGTAHERRAFLRTAIHGRIAPTTITVKVDGKDTKVVETLAYVSHEIITSTMVPSHLPDHKYRRAIHGKPGAPVIRVKDKPFTTHVHCDVIHTPVPVVEHVEHALPGSDHELTMEELEVLTAPSA